MVTSKSIISITTLKLNHKGGAVDPSMESGDWRAQLSEDTRQRIVNKIMGTLKKHLQFPGHEGLMEMMRIAERFEEKIYTVATSQTDYLRKISLKMLTMESKSHASRYAFNSAATSVNPYDLDLYTSDSIDMDMSNWRPAQGGRGTFGDSSIKSGDWKAQLQPDSRKRIVNQIMNALKKHLQFSGHEGLQELNKLAVRFEEKIYSNATSQSDYLRKLSLKMLSMEARSQNPIPEVVQLNSASSRA